MRIALLGVDNTTLAVAAAAIQSGKHQIVLIDGLAQRANEAASLAPQAKTFTEWETLLDGRGIDAIVIAADDPAQRVDQLRRLIQINRGIAILVSHPLSLSMLEVYEMEMIREESASVVMPYLPARFHPALGELQALLGQNQSAVIGAIEQITLERSMPRRDRNSVLRQFARDADILQTLAGNTTRLHAFASDPTSRTQPATTGHSQTDSKNRENPASAELRNLVVQMTTGDGLVSRWTVVPSSDQAGATLTLIGSQGEANLLLTDDARPWRLEVRSHNENKTQEFPDWNPAAVALNRLAEAHVSPNILPPTLTEAARTVELAETIDRSLARGRTIELHEEEFTDIGTFKGTMTSVGCGLLVVGMILLVVVALLHLLAVQAGWNQLAAKLDNWPFLLLGVCGIYLLLQPLVFIGKPRQKSSKEKPHAADDQTRQPG
jgi:predicted dehydrogenase